MAQHIQGRLYYERMGQSGPVMAFIHPSPMDQSCWIFQMAHFSTWYRCIALDLPGYGRSPKAEEGLTMEDMATACWETIDEVGTDEPAILVGCSKGSRLIPYMYAMRPERVSAAILSGAGTEPERESRLNRIRNYRSFGIDYRWRYTFEDFSPAFRPTSVAHYFAQMFHERNQLADVESIILGIQAVLEPHPERHYERIECPAVVISGSEDNSHARAFKLQKEIPECELEVLPGAGHACFIEQPVLFNSYVTEFLRRHGLFPVD